MPVRFWPSPHFTPGRKCPVDMIVIHAISLPPGVFGTGHVVDFFMGRLDTKAHPSFRDLEGLKVSSHFFLQRDGSLHQFVDTRDTAWHAGESHFMGRSACNDFSVGIELEGDAHSPFTENQYNALGLLLEAIIRIHPAITPDRVVGHSQVAPGRKWDPGPFFDWVRLQGMLRGSLPLSVQGDKV